MNGDVEEEAPRPRPLSGGIWTLFSWLRRTERSSSDESITSVGSDRTAVSFDFLAPFHYKHVNPPLVLPQSPLTDTYKKRLHERNIRRQHDRDLTLRRKYGLYTEEGLGYDAFSLPPARKIPKDSVAIQGRQRRATSESIIQPRAAYVPGKRRAPLPPTIVISTSLPRNYKRKRPAPKPPIKLTESNKENIKINEKVQMNSKTYFDKHSSESNSAVSEFKTEKYSKKDHVNKEVKLRTEKSFLKQIFDNRKRNSAIDTSHIKVLPSISELDKQAAEIIQTNKSLNSGSESHTEGNWICTNCLRKYNATILSCIYCFNGNSYNHIKVNKNESKTTPSNMSTQTENRTLESNKKNEIDEKQQLRKMLKEMKDSLPKKPKNCIKNCEEKKPTIMTATEMPTLRIGSTMTGDKKVNQNISNFESQFKKESDKKNNVQNARDLFFKSGPSSSKEVPRDTEDSNVKFMRKELQIEHNNCRKNDRPRSTCSSSFSVLTNKSIIKTVSSKGSVKNESLDTDKNPLLNKQLQDNILNENKQFKETTAENELKLKNISNQSVGKNNITLTTADIHVNNTSPEKSTLLIEERKIAPKNNVIEPLNVFDSKSPISKLSKQNQLNNDGVTKNITTSDKSKNFKVTHKVSIKPSQLFPIEETKPVREKSELNEKKIENLRLGDVISTNVTQKTEENTKVSPKINNNIDLHTPLKISSLLNPLYCPKNSNLEGNVKASQIDGTKKVILKQELKPFENKHILQSNISKLSSENPSSSSSSTTYLKIDVLKSEETNNKESKQKIVVNAPSLNINSAATTCDSKLDHHARRRDLINQLEQSIAKGDEQTAAEAAAKLAKLKLSCSVLSFSSQIVSGPLISEIKTEKFRDNASDKRETTILQPSEKQNIKSEIKDSSSTQEKSEISKLTNTIVNIENKPTEGIIANKPIASTSKDISDHIIPIDVWIEDKEATRGPIRLLVSKKTSMGDLKRQAEKSLGVQIRLQRWIIGKTLCSNDNTLLITLAGPELAAPFYLCLVESDTNKDTISQITNEIEKKDDSNEPKRVNTSDVYNELMKLEQQALVPNSEEFECGVCIEQCAIGEGVVLRECIHTFCRECLADIVRHCQEPVVSCPAIACPGALQEREIRALLSAEDYEKWLARSLAAAESGTRNTFHCRTRDCTGWAFCEPGVRRFPCPVCKITNCIPCQVVHDGETCEQYQIKLRETLTAVEVDQTDAGTQALLKSLIDRGEALECPECKAIITKKWGCDWIKCSACKTEICWVTKGRRWGPGGKGDTSGGCRCGVDGKRCHPSCGYCH